MSEILLTGFEPFGGDPRNPSSEACSMLDGEVVAGHRVRALCLPTAFKVAALKLLRQMARQRPALVIATGLAVGRAEITPERFALNFADARIPDNRGRQPRAKVLVRGAPLAYASTLPVDRIVARLHAAGIPATPSLSAGAFVCNELFFRLRHATETTSLRVGFIHVPYASEHVVVRPGTPSLPLAMIAQALRLAVQTSLE
ncbi:MAG: pyroglutamyl-peptidase I [Xanthomonadales bacterium]|nr:Pyrrolidone-carboxylate peptidase [Xanthomonadales bacterium]MCC6594062.1 pyroglutamyl-peptidase I [Xanthomonadales bacterium]MCE7930892.1 pyroglutamyl-peptidase I [Xanthomonadales bacterium PRO6]